MLERNQVTLAAQGEKIMVRNFKRSIIVLVVLILVASTFAFANANTIALSAIGYKAQAITGYAVSAIVYDLVDGTPTTVSKINFTIAPATVGDPKPAVVKISTTGVGLENFATSTCVAGGAAGDANWPVVCTFTAPINVIDIAHLDIIASSSANPVDP